MITTTLTCLILLAFLMVHYPALTVGIIAILAVGVWFVPQIAPQPTYDSSVRAPKDNSGLQIGLLVFGPLAISVIWGAAQRLMY